MLQWLQFVLGDLEDDDDDEDIDEEFDDKDTEDSASVNTGDAAARTVGRTAYRTTARTVANSAVQTDTKDDSKTAAKTVAQASRRKWNGCLPDSSMFPCLVLLCQMAVTALPISSMAYVDAMGNCFVGAMLASMGGVSIVVGRRLKGARLSSPKTWLLIALAVFPIIYVLFHRFFVITILYIIEVIVTGGVAGGLLCLVILLLESANLSENVFTWGIIVAVFGMGMANGFLTDRLFRKWEQADGKHKDSREMSCSE